jgi:hypothetical protein
VSGTKIAWPGWRLSSDSSKDATTEGHESRPIIATLSPYRNRQEALGAHAIKFQQIRVWQRVLAGHVLRVMSEPNAAPTPTPRRGPGCFSTLVLTFLAAVILGGIVVWKVVDSEFGLKWLAEHFQQRSITEVFRENVKRIASTNGDVLELATLESEETITKFDSKTLFDVVYLGTTESEVRAMVVYRYHLKLSDEWRLNVQDGRCIVVAPAIRPSLPPAIRTESMEKKSAAGWMRFNAAENLAALEKGLTAILEARAGMPGKIRTVREASRQSVAKFVQQWVLKDPTNQAQSGIREIVVVFPDEPAAKSAVGALKLPATLVLEVKAN